MATEATLISVIVPNFNGERFLGAALASLRSQTYQNLEVLVVDDCSTDNSPEIAERFEKQDPRFRLLRNDKNIGVSAVRARGIAESSGRYLTTLDNDDVLLDPRKLELELRVIHSAADADRVVAFSEVSLLDVSGVEIGKALHRGNLAEGSIFEDMLLRRVPIPRDMLFSRQLYDSTGGFDPAVELYEDWDLKLRLARQAEFRFSGSRGIGYRRHGTGLSSDNERGTEWLIKVFRKNAVGLEDADALELDLLRRRRRRDRPWWRRLLRGAGKPLRAVRRSWFPR